MNDTIQIYCKNTQKYYGVAPGTSLLELYNVIDYKLPFQLVNAKVNNVTQDLNYKIYHPKDIEFADVSSSSGMRTYVRSLCFVLYKAIEDVLPNSRLRIEHSISKGYYCEINHKQKLSDTDINNIKSRMVEIIDQDLPFVHIECKTEEAVKLFAENNMIDKVDLLESIGELYTSFYKLDNRIDYYYGSLVPSSGFLYLFDLIRYEDGMLLIPPNRKNPLTVESHIVQAKMREVLDEFVHLNFASGLSNVGKLNKIVNLGRANDVIKVSEAIQEKKISYIADHIASLNENENKGKIILISGPSSSGKTTFTKRLSVQLMTNLLRPVVISLDNYFVDREQTPRDANGEYDYESIHALDLQQFNHDLQTLIEGRQIEVPTYSFETGKRVYKGNKLKLHPASVLLIEGIHALNPELTPQIQDNLKYKIYVSALTTISLDDHNWIPTTDNRLLRRIVRDYKYRNYTAKETISRWESVRSGEDKWIFPYQENADMMFNSAMLYELAVLKKYAEPILREVPKNCPEYTEAYRLLKFLNYFTNIHEHEIPPTSLLREFLGGSSFKY